jgi:hypothetical protein
MKKITLLLSVVLALFIAGCSTKTSDPAPTDPGMSVEAKNMSLLNKFTGSLCPPCGGWGWDMFDALITYGDVKTCNIGTYSQNFVAQNYITQTATQMDSAYGAYKNSSGWPTFAVNGSSKLSRTSGVNVDAEKQMCREAIDAHFAAPCQANSNYEVSYDDGKKNITVKTRTKFFQDMSGDFYIAAYITEDKVLGPQSGKTGNVYHHDVLRGSINNKTWGTKISSSTTAGSQFDYTFTCPVNSSWNTDNITVVTVIWKKNGSAYDFVNAFRKIK